MFQTLFLARKEIVKELEPKKMGICFRRVHIT